MFNNVLKLACLSLCFFCASLFAHPHNWIDLKTEFFLDKQGKLTSLQQSWLFDVEFSQATIADIFHESRVQPNSLQLLGDDMINNMQSFDYFSHLSVDKRAISLPRPSDYELQIVEIEGQQQLYLRMKFTFKSALVIASQRVAWRVFDPTYYIDMKHLQKTDIVVHAANSNHHCTVQVQAATPSKRLQDYASGLDKSQTDYNRDFSEQEAQPSYVLDPLYDFQDRLGEEFAETIQLNCL